MPFPKPRSGEERDEFIGRCMSEEKEGIPDQDQRLRACHDAWREEHGEAHAQMGPEPSEDREEFLQRCGASASMMYEHPDEDDRMFVCSELWMDAMATVENSQVTPDASFEEKSDPTRNMQERVMDLFTHRSQNDGFSINASKRSAEILIYGEIGDELFGGISAKTFATELKNAGKLNNIVLRINSPGGNVFDGMAIFNTLQAHSAEVEVHIDGLAASAASVVAMAGQKIYAAENSVMMIHDPWALVIGSAEQMRAMAVSLDKIGDGMAKTYARRTGKSQFEMRTWMAHETWFSAEEAIEAGLVDEVSEPMKVAACFDIMAWRKRFRNPPEVLFEDQVEKTEPGTPIAAYKDNWRKLQRAKIKGIIQ